jgi:hypothetical protein
MSKELYDDIKLAINAVIKKFDVDHIKCHRRKVKYTNNQFISFCWSMFHLSGYDYDKCYSAGLVDNHIETALKKILIDYK